MSILLISMYASSFVSSLALGQVLISVFVFICNVEYSKQKDIYSHAGKISFSTLKYQKVHRRITKYLVK